MGKNCIYSLNSKSVDSCIPEFWFVITVTPQAGKVICYVTEAWVWITCAGWQVMGKGRQLEVAPTHWAAIQQPSSVLLVCSNLLECCEEMMLLWHFHKAKKLSAYLCRWFGMHLGGTPRACANVPVHLDTDMWTGPGGEVLAATKTEPRSCLKGLEGVIFRQKQQNYYLTKQVVKKWNMSPLKAI